MFPMRLLAAMLALTILSLVGCGDAPAPDADDSHTVEAPQLASHEQAGQPATDRPADEPEQPSYGEALQVFNGEREQMEYIRREMQASEDAFDGFEAKMKSLYEVARKAADANELRNGGPTETSRGLRQQQQEIMQAINEQAAQRDKELADLEAALERQAERLRIARVDLDAAEKRRNERRQRH